jgi:hypothetical protein
MKMLEAKFCLPQMAQIFADVDCMLMLASPPTLERIHDFIWLLAGTPTTASTHKFGMNAL